MIIKSEAKTFLELEPEYPFVDVRSPSEFAFGHIPGAFNLPLFSDDERAVIGTLFQKQGKDAAIVKGLNIALPKVFHYVDLLKNMIPGTKVAIHCWRGGMRSELMAEVFNKAGYKVSILEGGYKAYRQFIREALSSVAEIMVLGGYTGCGKTEILSSLAGLGEQVIDLESLACHKGSVFGALGQGSQPTNEQFENDLHRIWSGMDPARRIWLEDESRSIGKVALPPPVFEQISRAKMVKVGVDRNIRIARLVSEYSLFDKELLAEALFRIREGLGGARYQYAMKSLEESDFSSVADSVLEYYDKAYQKAIDKRENKEILTIALQGSSPSSHAEAILELLNEIENEPGLS